MFTVILSLTGISQLDLLKIWTDEAKCALEAKKSGTILDLWKVVAERKVNRREEIVVMCVLRNICLLDE